MPCFCTSRALEYRAGDGVVGGAALEEAILVTLAVGHTAASRR